MELAKDSPRSERGKRLFDEQMLTQRSNLDRLFSKLLLVQWAAAIVVALVYSPAAWAAKQQSGGSHFYVALLVGGALALIPMAMTRFMAGATATRHVMAAFQMLFSALFIHLSGGRIETHFHIFGSLAWLAFYLDWKILVTATVVVAAEHMVRGMLMPESVYGMVTAEHWRFVEHALWVVFEDVILFMGCLNGLRSAREGANRHAQLEELSESEQNKSAALEMAMMELQKSVKTA